MLASLIVVLAKSEQSNANYIRRFTPDEQMLKSTLVVIGSVESVFVDESVKFFEKKLAKLHVISVVKGDSDYIGKMITLKIKSGTSELNLNKCCTVGSKYLMFLESTDDQYYFTSTNIDYSIYEIP